MSLPLSTTTVTITRTDESADFYEEGTGRKLIAKNLAAHVSSAGGRDEFNNGGKKSVTEFKLLCEPVDLHDQDRVVDDITGEVFQVQWVRQRQELNLAHVEAGMRITDGGS